MPPPIPLNLSAGALAKEDHLQSSLILSKNSLPYDFSGFRIPKPPFFVGSMFRNLSVSFFCLLTPVSFCGVKRIFHLSFGQLSLGGITAQIALRPPVHLGAYSPGANENVRYAYSTTTRPSPQPFLTASCMTARPSRSRARASA